MNGPTIFSRMCFFVPPARPCIYAVYILMDRIHPYSPYTFQVLDHLEFYAAVKGFPEGAERDAAIAGILDMLDLGPKKHVRSLSLIGYRLWRTSGFGNTLQKSKVYAQTLWCVLSIHSI